MDNKTADAIIEAERQQIFKRTGKMPPPANKGAEVVFAERKAAGFPGGRDFIPNAEKSDE